jgi:hypothetical protein
MMERQIARAGRTGARVSSDDSDEAEDRLDRVPLEPLVEIVARRAGEELDAIVLPFEPEQTQRGLRLWRFRTERQDWPRAPVPWPCRAASQTHRSGARAAPHKRRAGRHRGRRTWRLRLWCPRRAFQIASVGQGQEIRSGALDNAQAVAMKIEIADDLRVQKRDRVGGDGIVNA